MILQEGQAAMERVLTTCDLTNAPRPPTTHPNLLVLQEEQAAMERVLTVRETMMGALEGGKVRPPGGGYCCCTVLLMCCTASVPGGRSRDDAGPGGQKGAVWGIGGERRGCC